MEKTALIPIVIGITGHRDLRREDLEHLGSAVESILKEIKRLYPSTPLILLTSLAEGADRLAAKVALELGVELIAPLPMSLKEYKKDFRATGSKQEFDELLGKVQDYFILPAVSGTSQDNQESERVDSYARSGAYVVNHSQILIALWDGVENGLLGGTAHTVRCKLEGLGQEYRLAHGFMVGLDQGPVYQIVTPRVSNPNPKQEAFLLKKHFPKAWGEEQQATEYSKQLLARIDADNNEILKNIPDTEERFKNS